MTSQQSEFISSLVLQLNTSEISKSDLFSQLSSFSATTSTAANASQQRDGSAAETKQNVAVQNQSDAGPPWSSGAGASVLASSPSAFGTGSATPHVEPNRQRTNAQPRVSSQDVVSGFTGKDRRLMIERLLSTKHHRTPQRPKPTSSHSPARATPTTPQPQQQQTLETMAVEGVAESLEEGEHPGSQRKPRQLNSTGNPKAGAAPSASVLGSAKKSSTHRRAVSNTDECTFTPRVTELPAGIYGTEAVQRTRVSSKLSVHERNLAWAEETKKERQALSEGIRLAEDEKCTFSPMISESSEKIVHSLKGAAGTRSARAITDRLFRESEVLRRKKKERSHLFETAKQAQLSKECTFRPNINKHSQRILQATVGNSPVIDRTTGSTVPAADRRYSRPTIASQCSRLDGTDGASSQRHRTVPSTDESLQPSSVGDHTGSPGSSVAMSSSVMSMENHGQQGREERGTGDAKDAARVPSKQGSTPTLLRHTPETHRRGVHESPDVKECTFHPKTNGLMPGMKDAAEHVHQKLYDRLSRTTIRSNRKEREREAGGQGREATSPSPSSVAHLHLHLLHAPGASGDAAAAAAAAAAAGGHYTGTEACEGDGTGAGLESTHAPHTPLRASSSHGHAHRRQQRQPKAGAGNGAHSWGASQSQSQNPLVSPALSMISHSSDAGGGLCMTSGFLDASSFTYVPMFERVKRSGQLLHQPPADPRVGAGEAVGQPDTPESLRLRLRDAQRAHGRGRGPVARPGEGDSDGDVFSATEGAGRGRGEGAGDGADPDPDDRLAITGADDHTVRRSFDAMIRRQSQHLIKAEENKKRREAALAPSFTPALNQKSLEIMSDRGNFQQRLEMQMQRMTLSNCTVMNQSRAMHQGGSPLEDRGVSALGDGEASTITDLDGSVIRVRQQPLHAGGNHTPAPRFKPSITRKASNMRPRSAREMSEGDWIRREQTIRRAKENVEAMELSMCRDPKLTRFAQEHTSKLKLQEPESYTHRISQFLEAREARIQQLKSELEEQESMECTFKPNVKPCPSYVSRLAKASARLKEARKAQQASKAERPQWK